ncbi:MAG TPA: MFS transporter [Steroidobacteraceae bacterium]
MAMSRAAWPQQAVNFVVARAVSSLGSALTTFALNVWVYTTTGSYTTFATLAVIAAFPSLLLAPACGLIVDRFPRKTVLIACDLIAAVTIAALGFGSWLHRLTIPAIGTVIVILSIVRTVSWPATSAAVSMLCTGTARSRINGFAESLDGAVIIFGPLGGAALLQIASLPTIASVDFLSYLVSILTVASLRFPAGHTTNNASQEHGGFISNCLFGIRWILARRELSRLLTFFAAINLGCAVFVTAYAPYVLSFANPAILGRCLALGGVGAVLGGAAFAATSGFRRHEIGVLTGALISGTSMIIFGICRSPGPLYVAAFAYGAAIPLTNASSQTIWQARTPTEIQGRVFSVRKMLAWALNPVSILLSIPMASALFAPLLERSSMVLIWGTGRAGTLGLMASTCGLVCFGAAAIALTFDWLRMPRLSRAAPTMPPEQLLRPGS